MSADGAKQVVVVTDEPYKYPPDTAWPAGVTIRPREELLEVERELSEIEGVTVLIYDQTCAAEKRRRRKRGEYPDPDKRAFINELVCEGCGDCGVKSNCVSIQPKETEFGRKRVDRPIQLQQGFLLRRRLLPVVRHRPRRQAAQGEARRNVAARRSRARAARNLRTGPMRSWSPASAARAW